MKNKYKIIIMLIAILFGCTGCNGNVTRDIRHAGFSIDGTEFECSALLPANDKDVNYTKIKYMTGTHVITVDGDIYELSLGQKYSNDQHCRKVDTNINVASVMDGTIVRGKDDKIYTLVGDKDNSPYTEVKTTNDSYSLYKLLLGDVTNIKVLSVNSNNGSYYVLKDDGNIYEYTVDKESTQSKVYKLLKSSVVYNKSDYDTNIIDFNYAGESLSTFIKTENKVYRMRITNAEECQKYADIKCKYKMVEDPVFETHKDKIIVYNGSTLITTYAKKFTVSS